MRPGLSIRRFAVALALVAGAGAAGTLAWAADASSSRVPTPAIVVDADTKCIDTPEVMRRTHMEMLKHQRDRTVRQGIRGEKVHLNACIDCHAGRGAGAAAGSVTGRPEAFCESCHSYAAVKLDCFECHQPKPSEARR